MGPPGPVGAGAAGRCADGAVGGALGAGPGCCPARAVSCACNLALVAWAGAWAAAVAVSPSPAWGWTLEDGAGAGAPLKLRPAHSGGRWQERLRLCRGRACCTGHGRQDGGRELSCNKLTLQLQAAPCPRAKLLRWLVHTWCHGKRQQLLKCRRDISWRATPRLWQRREQAAGGQRDGGAWAEICCWARIACLLAEAASHHPL